MVGPDRPELCHQRGCAIRWIGMGAPAARVGLDEYLTIDAESELKQEYLNGVVIAMAGASPRHNLIATNIATAFGRVLGDTPCRVFNSDQRVRVGSTGAYVYPDVTVVCDEPHFTDERPQSLENPLLVVEVLSPSTEDHDRGRKLAHYRHLGSVREILLVDPNEHRVEHYRRLSGGQWLITDVTAGQLELECLGGHLRLADVYAKTDSLPLDLPEASG
jgi:Uma2 family endonuclease